MHPRRIGLKNGCLTRIEQSFTGAILLAADGRTARQIASTHLKNGRIQRAIVDPLLMKLFLAICLYLFLPPLPPALRA